MNRVDSLQIASTKAKPSGIRQAVTEKRLRKKKRRLAQECSKLDPEFEQSLAEEGFSSELGEMPEY